MLADYFWLNPVGLSLVKDPDDLLSLTVSFLTGVLVSFIAETMIRSKKQCKESEKRYRSLVEWEPEAVIVHRDGRIIYVNCQGSAIYDTNTCGRLPGEPFLALVHPDDKDAVDLRLNELQQGQKVPLFDFRLMGADHQLITVEASGTRIIYDEEQATLLILRDITERKSLEVERLRNTEEMRNREQLLITQGRFAALGEMVNNIAHAWRQPLNHLGLIVQELPVYYKIGKLDQQYLESSVHEAMRVISGMSKTIEDFRDFVSPDKARVHFRAGETLQKVVSLVGESFEAMGLQIQVATEEEVTIEGFPNEYAQVILNILMNAKDALMGSNTGLPQIVVRLFAERGKSVLTVTDNAGGVPDDIIERIFDPYFTTKGPDKGTGIGLFMSKSIIERNMGGSLSVSNVAGGAQFRIEV